MIHVSEANLELCDGKWTEVFLFCNILLFLRQALCLRRHHNSTEREHYSFSIFLHIHMSPLPPLHPSSPPPFPLPATSALSPPAPPPHPPPRMDMDMTDMICHDLVLDLVMPHDMTSHVMSHDYIYTAGAAASRVNHHHDHRRYRYIIDIDI